MAEDIIRNENAVYQKYSTLIISPENIAHNVDVIRSITDRPSSLWSRKMDTAWGCGTNIRF